MVPRIQSTLKFGAFFRRTVQTSSNWRACGLSLKRLGRRTPRCASTTCGLPATILNSFPKLATNSQNIPADRPSPSRSKTDGASSSVDPRLPGTTCRANQSSNSMRTVIPQRWQNPKQVWITSIDQEPGFIIILPQGLDEFGLPIPEELLR